MQSDLSEKTLEKLKTLCLEFDIPYRYTDLKTALSRISTTPLEKDCRL